MSKINFKGLNEIRGIAALLVIWHHIELYKYREALPSIYNVAYLDRILIFLGNNGVLLFFSLSGFLITYLLLEEKSEFGKIDIGKFYMRRVVRIWPLYFLIVFCGFILLPFIFRSLPGFFGNQAYASPLIWSVDLGKNFVLFLFFLSNISMGNFPPVLGASQTWSVSVEEQFYLFWPWLLKYFNRRLPVIFIVIIFLVFMARYLVLESELLIVHGFLRSFIYTFHIDFMAMGALFAYFFFHYQAKMEFWLKKPWLLTGAIILVILLLYIINFRLVRLFGFSLVIPLAIVWKFELGFLNRLGKISYGLYMYHGMVLILGFPLLQYFNMDPNLVSGLLYPLVFGGTYLIGTLSYRFLEQPLLKKKQLFYQRRESPH